VASRETRLEAQRAAVVAGVLVVLTVLGAALAGPWLPRTRPDVQFTLGIDFPTPTPRPQETGPGNLDDLAGEGSVAAWVKVVLVVVGLVLLVLLSTAAVRAARRWLSAHTPPEVDRTEAGEVVRGDLVDLARPALAEGVEAAVDALDRDVPPGDAVVAAWVALEEAAERSGVLREPAQTATEFTLELLDATEADATASRTLLDLYLAARFSGHPITSDDVVRARASLAALGAGVRHRRDGRGPDDAVPASGAAPGGPAPTGTTPAATAPTGTTPAATAPTGAAPTGTTPTGTAPTDDAPTHGVRS